MTNRTASEAKRPRNGLPGSTIFRRGTTGRMDGNSAAAKYVKVKQAALVAELAAQLGRTPSVAQCDLLGHASLIAYDILGATDPDVRLRGIGVYNRLLRQAGLKANVTPGKTARQQLDEHLDALAGMGSR